MAGTSGLSAGTNGIAQVVLGTLTAGSTATPTTVTVPLKVLFLSAVRTTNTGTDTEWATAAGYTAGAGGTTGGVAGPTWNAITTNGTVGATVTNSSAVTLSNAPAQTWAGNIIRDSAATTNKELWYAPLTGGNKTVNLGDTCTIPSGSLTLNLG
jgi:hypothetical protein